jgi:hypothetical protein
MWLNQPIKRVANRRGMRFDSKNFSSSMSRFTPGPLRRCHVFIKLGA